MHDPRARFLLKLERFVDMAADSSLPAFLPLHYLIRVLVPAAARVWGTEETARLLAEAVMEGLGTHLGHCTMCHRTPPAPGDAERLCAGCRAQVDKADADFNGSAPEEPPFDTATAQRIARDLAAAGVEMTPNEVTATGTAAFTKLRDSLRERGVRVPDTLPETVRFVADTLAPLRREARAALRAADVRVLPVAPAPDTAVFVCTTCGKPRPGTARALLFFPGDELAYPICVSCHKEPPCELT